jgi:hypothetical protein
LPPQNKSQQNQADSATDAYKSGIDQIANQHSKAEGRNTAAQQVILPAHKNTPCLSYAGGVAILTA